MSDNEIWVDIECECKKVALTQWIEPSLIEDSYSELASGYKDCDHSPEKLNVIADFGDSPQHQISCKGDNIRKIINYSEYYLFVADYSDQMLAQAILGDFHGDHEQCANTLKDGRFLVYQDEVELAREAGVTLKNCGTAYIELADGRLVFTS